MTRAFGIRLTASIALAAAGLLSLMASAGRWWPDCQPGRFGSDECQNLLTNSYDEAPIGTIWDPTWVTNGYLMAASLLTAIGMVLVGRMSLAREKSLVPLVLGGVVIVTYQGVIWRGYYDSGVGDLWAITWLCLTFWAFVGPGVLVGTWRTSVKTGRSAGWSDVVMFAALILTTPLIALVVGPWLVGGSSYRLVPWSDALVGAALLVAGLAAGWGLTNGRSTSGTARAIGRARADSLQGSKTIAGSGL
jgi:hypothetical protein